MITDLTTAVWMGVRWVVGIEPVEVRQRFLPLPRLRLGPRLVVEYREVSNMELVGVLVGLAVASTGFNALFPGLNVFVLVLPAEAHLETVWVSTQAIILGSEQSSAGMAWINQAPESVLKRLLEITVGRYAARGVGCGDIHVPLRQRGASDRAATRGRRGGTAAASVTTQISSQSAANRSLP